DQLPAVLLGYLLFHGLVAACYMRRALRGMEPSRLILARTPRAVGDVDLVHARPAVSERSPLLWKEIYVDGGIDQLGKRYTQQLLATLGILFGIPVLVLRVVLAFVPAP